MATDGLIRILFHQDFDTISFSDFLRKQGIHTLIYVGIASNMCVIGRPTGMVPMLHNGFRLFFIPQASAAVEFRETWATGAIHSATTIIISQSIAELIDLNEFLSL